LNFNLERVMRHLTYLTSLDTAGRLSGTEGAKKTATYLANQLSSMGYKSAGTHRDFFQPVNVPATRLLGPARLVIGKKEFKHRIDFAELLMVSSGGEAEGELFVLRDGDDVDPVDLDGKIVLIPEQPEGFDIRGTVATAIAFGVKGLLIEFGEPQWFSKTMFGSNENQIPVFRIRTSIAKQLTQSVGLQVTMKLPIETNTLACQNVLGLLESKGAKETLVLSAHYDHLGDDPQGLRFPGAIDNGSGVAVVLEAARHLAQTSKPLPFHILVAFFTGEESSLWGAKQFISDPPIPISAAINLDCLGFEFELNALRVGHASPGHWLPDLAAKIIETHGVEVKWISGGDDAYAFLEKNIPVLGLGQKPTLPSSVKIHTPEDTLSSLHTKPLETGFSILMEVIMQIAEQDLLRVHSPDQVGMK
jgi:aminopeptidase YwaD